MAKKPSSEEYALDVGYAAILDDLAAVIAEARSTLARSVNTVMTSTYWFVGRRIVEHEQSGQERAAYGEVLLARLAEDLTSRFGRGFSQRNLHVMRRFYLVYPIEEISQTLSAKSALPEKWQTLSAKLGPLENHLTAAGDLNFENLARCFPLPWSSYVQLLSVKKDSARRFYETEALRGGRTVRQLKRQIESQFYERTALSKNKAAMLENGQTAQPEDAITPQDAIKDPFVLEFLDLKDEYSESDLEAALIHHLETFVLELGSDFCFIGRQKRLRVGDTWNRVDLTFFHRRLRCLVIIDLKIGTFTHADAGQMHLYLNYAREHWTHEAENPPVGLILCAQKDATVAHYALDGLPHKVMAAEYRTALPNERTLVAEIERTRAVLEERGIALLEPQSE